MYWNSLWLITCIRLTCGEIVVPPTDSLDTDWWQHSVIYEIFPLSFKDSNGDGSGDFIGIAEKLDYIADLGVTAIWLTPFAESPLQSGGYDVSDYLKIQKVFGSQDHLEYLLKEAHKKNLKVIMDFIPNHTSDEHVWFKNSRDKKSKYIDYYIWRDAKNQAEVMINSSITPEAPNNWRRINGNDTDNSGWIWDDERRQFYFTQFNRNLPDLNLRHTSVLNELKKVLNFWLNLGLDGIRIDALRYLFEDINMESEPVINDTIPLSYNNLNHIYTVDQDEIYDLIAEWRQILDDFKKKDNKTRIMITNSRANNIILFEYYNHGVEIPTNFHLMDLINTHNYNVNEWNNEIRNFMTSMPNGSIYNVILQTHDQLRFQSQFIDAMNALSLFLPGVAMVYYGGEIGMADDGFSRSPMQWDDTTYAGFSKTTPWIKIQSNHEHINVQNETIDKKSYLSFFKSLTALRRTPTFKRGGLDTYIFNDTVYVLTRFLPHGYNNYTLIINMDLELQHVRLLDQIKYLDNNMTIYSGSGNSNFNAGDTILTNQLIELSPGATIILTKNTINTSTSTSTISTSSISTSSISTSTPTTPADQDTNSSAMQLCTSFLVLLLCLIIIKMCNV